MKSYFQFALASVLAMLLTSCEAVGDIFQACMWWGIILVVGVIGLIIWILTRSRK